jgi:glucose/arabinose dehydrogenase/mono/diheme cytochrome c family protein
MRSLGLWKIFAAATAGVAAFAFFGPFVGNSVHTTVKAAAASGCSSDDSGLKLPPGFCATIFADNLGHARHLAIAPNGVVYVNTWSGRYYPPGQPLPAGGFLVALQDKSGSGKADVIERFGATEASGGAGGTGIALYNGSLYAELNDRIVRYALTPGSIVPTGPEVTVVSGLPLGGDHPMHPFFIAPDGTLYVDVATATNACQLQNRTLHSPGASPCVELETRGGVWRFDAKKTDQKFSPAERYATGIRNAEGFGYDPAAKLLYVTQHGRDQLHANWPEHFAPEQEATLPSEEVMLLTKSGDYGWPECYYDPGQGKLMLAPEYGGDGKTVGLCATKTGPVAAFPSHWGPNGMAFYDKTQFPARYQGGLFIAFHGSWDRAPYAQGGYNIVFQPVSAGHAKGTCEIFADGFAGSVISPGGAVHRPSGVAVAPDGALFVADDTKGRIYRITYQGGAPAGEPQYTPCPSLTAPAGEIEQAQAKPPEGTHPDAGAASSLPVPSGATPEMVALGNRIYHGEVGGAMCTGCHGANAAGTPLGPDLTAKKWLWSDGSWQGIGKTITEGVSMPKQYRAPMPAMGGSQLSPEQVQAVAAYLWALNHK